MTIFCILLNILSLNIYANEVNDKMNGISLSDYKDFTKKWELISVRYRKDSTEMRFVYANDIAAKTLREEKKTYPKNSVFGKVSFATGEDPNFTSSVLPIRPSRIQFMVRDESKFTGTAGWGYALFKPSGELMPGDMKQKTLSCAACHSLVEEQGHVFSSLMGYARPSHFSMPPAKKLKYSKVKKKKLPKKVRNLIPKNYEFVNSLQGVLKKHLFYGTLDEIRPSLTKKTLMTKLPTILLGDNQSSFSIVFIDKSNRDCPKNEVGITSYHVGAPPKNKVIKTKFCELDK